MINHYELLGVPRTASQEEIKSAYKKRAFETHPDKNPGTEDLFKSINNAYQVLSDTVARERYDLNLQYSEETQTTYVRTRPRPQPYHYHKYRQGKKQTEYERWMSKDNLKATMFAFLFALGVGTLVMAAVRANNYYKERQYEEFLADRRLTFEQAQLAFNSGNFKETLSLLGKLGGLRSTEADIDNYKAMVVKQLYNQGMEAYQKKNYQKALRYFDLVKEYSVTGTANFQKILAECYLGIEKYDKGLEILRVLLVNGFRDIDVLLKIAGVYEFVIKDYQQALNYYQWGNRITLEEYESMYGRAFPLLLHRGIVPASHYELQLGLARTYHRVGEHQKALDAAQWSVSIWPDSAANYVIRAEAALATNDTRLACKEYKTAKRLNAQLDLPDICK